MPPISKTPVRGGISSVRVHQNRASGGAVRSPKFRISRFCNPCQPSPESMIAEDPKHGFMSKRFIRNLETRTRESLEDTPVVLVNGHRRSGKTTFVRGIAEKETEFAA